MPTILNSPRIQSVSSFVAVWLTACDQESAETQTHTHTHTHTKKQHASMDTKWYIDCHTVMFPCTFSVCSALSWADDVIITWCINMMGLPGLEGINRWISGCFLTLRQWIKQTGDLVTCVLNWCNRILAVIGPVVTLCGWRDVQIQELVKFYLLTYIYIGLWFYLSPSPESSPQVQYQIKFGAEPQSV